MTQLGRHLRRGTTLTVLAVVLAAAAFTGYWAASGGRWYIVRTPSMATAAPVGTLLWVKPVAFSQLQVGDLITFHPPGSPSTYSHRVFARDPDGDLRTKGDANSAPDPWKLTSTNVVGRTQMRWWGIGWLVRAAPILLLGSLALWFAIRRFARRELWLPLTTVGSASLASLSIYLYRPLVGADQLALVPDRGGARATYISTGLLRLRLAAPGGGHVSLRNGQTGSVLATHQSSDGRFAVSLHPDVQWWMWVALVLACFVPAIANFARGGTRSGRAPQHQVV